MKILFINNTLFSIGGVNRVLSCIASELSKKHDVTIWAYCKKEKENRSLYGLSEKVRVENNYIYKKGYIRRFFHKINQKTNLIRWIGSGYLYDWIYIPLQFQKQMIDYINNGQYDAVCAVQANNSIALGKIKDRIKCKTFGWQHSSYEAYWETKGTNFYNQDYLLDKYISKLDGCIVLNEHVEAMYKLKKGIEAITIYNPKSFISAKKSQVTNKKFIACGGLKTPKGFDLLIESFEEFSKREKEWVLNIWGAGPDEKKLRGLIKKKELNDRVKLMGVTDNIAKEMIDSSALLLSSRWEGMPMVVLEALECGLPIISYDITAIKPLVTDGLEGRVVPAFDTMKFSDAMLHMAMDLTKRKEYGANAANKAKLFAKEDICKKWDMLFTGNNEFCNH